MDIRVERSHTVEAKPFQVNKMLKNKKNFQANLKLWKQLFNNYLPDDFLPSDIAKHSLRLDFYMDEDMDLDNSLKYTIDALEDKYKFNDRNILHIVAYKHPIDLNWRELKKGIKDRYRIKISLTERLQYDDFDNNGKPFEEQDINNTTPDEDYKLLFDLATYGLDGKS
jgi:hypothetical protein